jgi:hypothetical protein
MILLENLTTDLPRGLPLTLVPRHPDSTVGKLLDRVVFPAAPKLQGLVLIAKGPRVIVPDACLVGLQLGGQLDSLVVVGDVAEGG